MFLFCFSLQTVILKSAAHQTARLFHREFLVDHQRAVVIWIISARVLIVRAQVSSLLN